MIENDTIKLLRECDAGVKMGITSISDVIDRVKSEDLKSVLNTNKLEHEKLESQIQQKLIEYKDEGKDPDPMAKGMSWLKTNFMIGMNHSDEAIADLLTDGCNMGVKSLNSYLNKYKAADEHTKDITKKLINLEERLAVDMRDYL